MATFETYRAAVDPQLALKLAAETSPFTIEVRFMGGLTDSQKNAFKTAADRWSRVIIGDLPSVQVDGEVIDDLLILASGQDIDGSGGVLGQAGPTALRPRNAGAYAYISAKGIMQFDIADLGEMETNGTLTDVITHEMGHVIGFGTIWSHKRLLKGARTDNPTFVGSSSMEEYGKLKGTGSTSVPVEANGGPGTRDSHWREVIFKNELMTGWVAASGNPMSRLTVASLKDLGYVVDLDAAEPYSLPDHLMLAEAGLLGRPPVLEGIMLGIIPMVLPDDSLL